MAGETFFTTAAQVLPTLIIAILLETRGVIMGVSRGDQRFRTERALTKGLDKPLRPNPAFRQRLLLEARIIAAIFIIGEISALVGVFVDSVQPVRWVAAALVVPALVVLTVLAVAQPLQRIRIELFELDAGDQARLRVDE